MKLKWVNWVRTTQNFNKKEGSEIHAGFLISIKFPSTIEQRYKTNHNQSSVVFLRIEPGFTIYYKSASRNMDIIGW